MSSEAKCGTNLSDASAVEPAGGGPSGLYRILPEHRYSVACRDLDVGQLTLEASWSAVQRRQAGADRLRSLLDYALAQVPVFAALDRGAVAERELEAFPIVSKSNLRSVAGRVAAGAVPGRWNSTSGSTNLPLRTPLGIDHERNQVVRWLRHWHTFGINSAASVLYVVPRAYRLRVFGGGELRDVAGGHVVHQLHPGPELEPLPADVVVANPHVLEQVYPDGWPFFPRLLITSYEQRPQRLHRWPAERYGDVYGLSEVGDVAWQRVGDSGWQLHHDLVWCEVLPVVQLGAEVVGELVVTDLTNKIMPIIRYRTGDIVRAEVDGARIISIRSIIGRRIQTRGTPLGGVDIMSKFLPALIDTAEGFRVAASSTEVIIYTRIDRAERDRLRSCLAPVVPSIKVTDDPRQLEGLHEIFQMPAIESALFSSETPPPLNTLMAPCRCAQRPLATDDQTGIRTCNSGDVSPSLLCLPPGPGIGHQILRSLHEIMAGMATVRLVEYPGHGSRIAEPLDRNSLLSGLAELAAHSDILLGHSFGADIAVDVIMRSHSARGLILISPPPPANSRHAWGPGHGAVTARMRAGEGGGTWYRRYLAQYALPLGLGRSVFKSEDLLNGVPTYEGSWRLLRNDVSPESLYDRLRRMIIPTLIISGRDDPLMSHDEVAKMGRLRHVRVARLNGGHFPYVDAQADLRAAAVEFFKTLPPRDLMSSS